MNEIHELVGKKFNRLTITEVFAPSNGRVYGMAICECGTIKRVRVSDVKCGEVKSCGCLLAEFNSSGANCYNHLRTHGLSDHPLFVVFDNMKGRCYRINNNAYPNYGAIGVIICDEWLNSFQSFYDWAMANGWKPGLQIDKDKLSPTKPGKLYSPEFCCFLTRTENIRFRRNSVMIVYNGEEKCLPEWAEITGIPKSLLWWRIKKGWDVKRALETPSSMVGGRKKKKNKV